MANAIRPALVVALLAIGSAVGVALIVNNPAPIPQPVPSATSTTTSTTIVTSSTITEAERTTTTSTQAPGGEPPQIETTTEAPATTAAPTTTAPDPAATVTLPPNVTHTVSMIDFGNQPQNITIKTGDTVRWVNNGFSGHDSTSGNDPAPDGIWASPEIPVGGSWSRIFDTPGTYSYFCALHPTLMPGTVTVEG